MAESDTDTDTTDTNVVSMEQARALLEEDQSDDSDTELSEALREELSDLLGERDIDAPNDTAINPNPGEQETRGNGARVELDETERDAYQAYHTLRLMEGSAKRNDRMVQMSLRQLIRGGHYGKEAANLLNNGMPAERAVVNGRQQEAEELASRMFEGEEGVDHRAAGDYYSTLVDADGAHLLPTQVVSEIEEIAEQVGVILGLSTTFNQLVGTLKVPGASGADSAMSFVAEGGEITSRIRSFRAVELNPKKVADIIPWTYEAQVEIAPQILADIQRVMGRAYGKAVDDAALFGDGTASYNSIDGLNSGNRTVPTYTIPGGSNDGTEFTHFQPDDLTDAQNNLAPGVRDGITAVFHPDMKLVFKTLKDDNGQYVYDYQQNPEGIDTVEGVPVQYTEALPANSISAVNQTDSVFGAIANWDYLKIGLGQGMTTEEARAGTVKDADTGNEINLFTQDLRALKYRAFFDMDLNFEGAFTLIKTST